MSKSEAKLTINKYICSCGCPSMAMKWLHLFLDSVQKGHDLRYIAEHLDTGICEVYLAAYLLDSMRIIGHIETISRPWLADTGTLLLDALSVAAEYDYDYGLLCD